MFTKPKLLAPAGDIEKLKIAVLYGADEVYAGGYLFSLRSQANNFSYEDLKEGVEFCHAHGVKMYVTVNIYAHNSHLQGLGEYLVELQDLGIDAVIISDPGVFAICRKVAPNLPIHISTQANTTNVSAASFWQELGAERIVLARELSIAEAGEVAMAGIDTEIFVHGAMCVAQSGRCLISSFMVGKSANLGDCTQPCRWNYRLEESKRGGEYYPVEEDDYGTYFFNSKDLCLIDFMPEIIRAGIGSLKIEGRMKSIYYVANVVRIYREALDECFANIDNYTTKDEWNDELRRISHRKYTSAFAIDGDKTDMQIYDTTVTVRGYDFSGIVIDSDGERLHIQQRNNMRLGDKLEIIIPHGGVYELELTEIWDEKGQLRESLPHAKEIAYIGCNEKLPAGSIIRRPVREV